MAGSSGRAPASPSNSAAPSGAAPTSRARLLALSSRGRRSTRGVRPALSSAYSGSARATRCASAWLRTDWYSTTAPSRITGVAKALTQ